MKVYASAPRIKNLVENIKVQNMHLVSVPLHPLFNVI